MFVAIIELTRQRHSSTFKIRASSFDRPHQTPPWDCGPLSRHITLAPRALRRRGEHPLEPKASLGDPDRATRELAHALVAAQLRLAHRVLKRLPRLYTRTKGRIDGRTPWQRSAGSDGARLGPLPRLLCDKAKLQIRVCLQQGRDRMRRGHVTGRDAEPRQPASGCHRPFPLLATSIQLPLPLRPLPLPLLSLVASMYEAALPTASPNVRERRSRRSVHALAVGASSLALTVPRCAHASDSPTHILRRERIAAAAQYQSFRGSPARLDICTAQRRAASCSSAAAAASPRA